MFVDLNNKNIYLNFRMKRMQEKGKREIKYRNKNLNKILFSYKSNNFPIFFTKVQHVLAIPGFYNFRFFFSCMLIQSNFFKFLHISFVLIS